MSDVSALVKVMLAVVYAVVCEKKGASSMTVWDVFHVLLGRSVVSGLRIKNLKKLKSLKIFLET